MFRKRPFRRRSTSTSAESHYVPLRENPGAWAPLPQFPSEGRGNRRVADINEIKSLNRPHNLFTIR